MAITISIVSMVITIALFVTTVLVCDEYFKTTPFARAYQIMLITLILFIGFGFMS